MAIVLPHIRVIKTLESFPIEQLDDILQFCLGFSGQKPCYLEVTDETTQLYLFYKDRQIYAAGRIRNQNIEAIDIKEFMIGCSGMQSPYAYCYEVNNKLLHSLLIVFQKKPSISVQTSLVDLDKLLDKIEEEGKSCIVHALQEEFFAILRYEKGIATALCHQQSQPYPREESFREDFLVKIYTFSAEKQLLICLFDDLLVNFAKDARLIEENYLGSIVDLYLAKPPIVIVKLKDKEVDRYVLEKTVTKIGRTPDNDICIDNLAVSRVHAILENNKGTFYVKDCDSLNGTLLNGSKVGCAKLGHRDVLRVGKHDIVFLKQEGREVPEDVYNEGLDQTVIISGVRRGVPLTGPGTMPQEQPATDTQQLHPRLLEKTPDGDRIIELLKPALVFGNDETADVSIHGFLVAAHHAEIVRRGDHYVIRHLKGFRKVKVGGKSVSETVLKPNDTIEIANREFTFLE